MLELGRLRYLRDTAKRTVHLLAPADRYVREREREGRVEYNSSDSVPGGGRGKGGRQTDRASCAEDKFSERANVEEEKEGGAGLGRGW